MKTVRKYGVLVISHGSRSASWVKLVDEAVSAMRLSASLPVECSFLESVAQRMIQDGINRLEAQGITDLLVVPLFICAGSSHVAEIAWAFGANPAFRGVSRLAPLRVQSVVHFLAPLDDDPEVAEMLLDNIRPLSVNSAKEVVLIVAHGSGGEDSQAKWQTVLGSLAGMLKTRGGFAHVEGATLSTGEVPVVLRKWADLYPEADVIVVPFFLSEGYFTKTVIPAELVGFKCRYNGAALLPSPRLVKWLERRIADFWQEREG
ncbi:MAG TPA: CbiX/SirB N-terminal domain-containing protein [Bacilli bacterium]